MTMTENNVAAQAGDEPMGICCYGGPLRPKSSCASCAAWQVSPRATADVERESPPHGHRDDFYLMANARSLAMNSIHTVRSMPNWVFAMKLFATGSTSAHEICARAGIDPDGISIERATTKPGA